MEPAGIKPERFEMAFDPRPLASHHYRAPVCPHQRGVEKRQDLFRPARESGLTGANG